LFPLTNRPFLIDDSGLDNLVCPQQKANLSQETQKVAIYRQMLEYRRMYEREERKVSAIEAQRRVYEASVHAVETCLAQVSHMV